VVLRHGHEPLVIFLRGSRPTPVTLLLDTPMDKEKSTGWPKKSKPLSGIIIKSY